MSDGERIPDFLAGLPLFKDMSGLEVNAVSAFLEPRQYIRKYGRVLFDTQRFFQTGHWSGKLEVKGETFDVTPDRSPTSSRASEAARSNPATIAFIIFPPFYVFGFYINELVALTATGRH